MLLLETGKDLKFHSSFLTLAVPNFTQVCSLVHRRSTIWVTAGTSPGTQLLPSLLKESQLCWKVLPACCVCLLILFMIVYVKKQQQLDSILVMAVIGIVDGNQGEAPPTKATRESASNISLGTMYTQVQLVSQTQ